MLWRAGKEAKSTARLAQIASLALAVLLVILLNWRPSVDVTLDVHQYRHDSGFAYIGLVPKFWHGAYRFVGDTDENRVQSTLVLREDGHPLGPQHASHDAVRQIGDGAYSHWDNHQEPFIIFSASDNSDPRSNGKHYTIVGRPYLIPILRSLLTGIILLILLSNLYIQARRSGLLGETGVKRQTSSFDYRGDIDGLRAVAVTLVILFHLGFSWIPGGYIGVDVFFVISGYLITGIVSQQIDAGKFSFVRFYARRIKRIFPALFVTVAATVAAGFFFLLPGDYVTASKSAVYAVSATSNFYFLFNTGYFDAAAELMPLLHTWSLGVEEQFYLLWPALLVGMAALFGRSGRSALITLLLIGFLSFMCGTILIAYDPKAAFYLPVTRAWEFVAGALLSHAAISRFQVKPLVAHVLTAIGLALIVISALVVTKTTPFPSWSTVLPIIGAALIVAPFQTQCLTRKLLGSWPFVFVGQISYSLYLWHWPVITLYRHYNLDRPISLIEALCLSAVIIVASVLSWRYVELPFRRASAPPWLSIGTGFATAAALAAVSLVVVFSAGFPQRIPPSARLYSSIYGMWAWKCPQETDIPEFGSRRQVCVLGADWKTAKIRGILMGDSHAEHFAPLLDDAARRAGVAILEPDISCMPLVGTTPLKRHFPLMPTYNTICTESFTPVDSYLSTHGDIRLVILAAAWSAYPAEMYWTKQDPLNRPAGVERMLKGIKEFTTRFARGTNRQFLIIADVPRRQPFDVGCLARSKLLLRPACPDEMFMTQRNSVFLNDAIAVNDMIRKLPSEIKNVTVSIPFDHMCNSVGCPTVLNHEFLYRDASHLRRNMGAKTKDMLIKRLRLTESLEAAIAPLH